MPPWRRKSAFLPDAEDSAEQGLEQRRGFDHDDLHDAALLSGDV